MGRRAGGDRNFNSGLFRWPFANRGLLQTGISPLIGLLADRVGFTPVCWLVGLSPFAAWLLLRRVDRNLSFNTSLPRPNLESAQIP